MNAHLILTAGRFHHLNEGFRSHELEAQIISVTACILSTHPWGQPADARPASVHDHGVDEGSHVDGVAQVGDKGAALSHSSGHDSGSSGGERPLEKVAAGGKEGEGG